MSAYRFCRTDDIPLLVDAWNRCHLPHDPAADPLTVAAFKQEIRELDLWCSSCMVGFEADEPVAVVIGCKRPPDTLVRRIAVHPDHVRRGHGRHLLTSLSAKLAILGPPRLVAEIPAENAAARGLFAACGWREVTTVSDLALDPAWTAPSPVPGAFLPVTLDDVAGDVPESAAWERTRATLEKRRERLRGLALLSEEGVRASILHTAAENGVTPVWSHHEAGGADGALAALVRELARRTGTPVVLRSHHGPHPAGFTPLAQTVVVTTVAVPA